jgi:endonuclease/exonuclease/phosphatase family metal-dependent hydrolase
MKKILFLLLFITSIASAQSLNTMTFNIRYSTLRDSANAWIYRKDQVADQIKYHQVQLLGVQEALYEQMTELKERLPQFKYVGGGREDGKQKGEYSAIFYDTTQLQLLDSKMFWLSTTPEVPSKGWDADFPRVVTWGKFKHRKSGKIFFAFNTHFDHIGKIARRESAKLLLQKVKEIAGNTPATITGDFNAHPDDEPIEILMNTADPLHLIDSKAISKTAHYGPTGTFNGFTNKETGNRPIDYIFLQGQWTVNSHATISETWNGLYASDHFSVLANLSW